MMMKFKTKLAVVSTAVILTLNSFFANKLHGQEFSAQVLSGTYKNATQPMLGIGFAAQKPLSDKLSAGFDLTFAASPKPDAIEAAQLWLSYKLGDSSNVSISPFLYKDRFYSVSQYGAGVVLSIGKLNLIAEYDEPKTYGAMVSYRIPAGDFTISPKLISLRFSDKAVDLFGGELKVSYDAGKNVHLFMKVKTLDLLTSGKCTTNAQAGVNIGL